MAGKRAKFPLFRLEDKVVLVFADYRLVGGHLDNLQPVYFIKLLAGGFGGTGHAGELVVKPKVILVGYARKGPTLFLHGDALFRLYSLMQALAPATPRLHSAGKLIHYHHLPLAHDILLVAVKKRLGTHGGFEVVHVFDAAFGVYIFNSKQLFRHLVCRLLLEKTHYLNLL